MLEHEAGADMRLVRQINTQGMKIQHGGENMGCSKVGENQENQVICLQCQDEVARVCPGSPRRAITTRLSSGSADREPSSSSYNASSGTFYSCVSQITIGVVDCQECPVDATVCNNFPVCHNTATSCHLQYSNSAF